MERVYLVIEFGDLPACNIGDDTMVCKSWETAKLVLKDRYEIAKQDFYDKKAEEQDHDTVPEKLDESFCGDTEYRVYAEDFFDRGGLIVSRNVIDRDPAPKLRSSFNRSIKELIK